jgi:hypothetical protein
MVQEIEDWEKFVDAHPDSRGLQMQLEVAYNKKGCTGRGIEGWKWLMDKISQATRTFDTFETGI